MRVRVASRSRSDRVSTARRRTNYHVQACQQRRRSSIGKGHVPAVPLPTLDVRTRRQWRAWLTKHHASSPGIWLVRHKQHTGVESMSYEDLVREALCFAWVD